MNPEIIDPTLEKEIIAADIDHDQKCDRCGGKATAIVAGLVDVRYLCEPCLEEITKPWQQIMEKGKIG